jgi:hypothetical protein
MIVINAVCEFGLMETAKWHVRNRGSVRIYNISMILLFGVLWTEDCRFTGY